MPNECYYPLCFLAFCALWWVFGVSARLSLWWHTTVLHNKAGVEVHVISTGATIRKLLLPDRDGVFADVVLGFDSELPYSDGRSPYFGAVAGRVANRIANARFAIDGHQYSLGANEQGYPGCLHGGARGFDKVMWRFIRSERPGKLARLRYVSADGEEGFPGKLTVDVSYELTESSELLQEFRARVEGSATPINLAQHSYFNLGGHDSGSVLNHTLTLHDATHVLPIDRNRIPTGRFDAVAGTAHDFLRPRPIGSRISEVGGPGWSAGYDQCWVLHGLGASVARSPWQAIPKRAATLTHERSGRSMQILTTAPGLQLYTSNFLDGSLDGKAGARYGKYAGVCLETQNLPDAINQAPHFPSAVLTPGEEYRHSTVYVFSSGGGKNDEYA